MKNVHAPDLRAGDVLNALESALYHGRLARRDFMRLAIAAGAGLATAQAMAEDGGDAAITQLYNSRNVQPEYDYVVINDDLDRAFSAVRAIATAERLRRDRRPGLFDFVSGLLAEQPS